MTHRCQKDTRDREIKKTKNRKPPDTDDIPNELLKYDSPDLTASLTTLFNKILNTTEISND